MIQILMSTFNGEKFIYEQLESLRQQDYMNTCILIRDDGSTDNTASIIVDYKKRNNPMRIDFYQGPNIGVVRSFFDLLQNSNNNAEYYAFCDQDDYWLQNKLSRAVSKINELPSNLPVMYCSRTQLVDESLQHRLGKWPPEATREVGFANALVQNVAVGCTIVLNKKARDLLLKKEPDFTNIIMHDWWAYLCISAFGNVVYDDEPFILYRQHRNNAVGGNGSIVSKLAKRWSNFKKNGYKQRYKIQAKEFYRLHSEDVPSEIKTILRNFIMDKNVISRVKYSLSGEVYRHSLIGNLALKLLIVSGRY